MMFQRWVRLVWHDPFLRDRTVGGNKTIRVCGLWLEISDWRMHGGLVEEGGGGGVSIMDQNFG